MTKEEYTKTLEKHMAKVADSKYDDYYAGCFDGLKKAIDLAEKLDEPKKVVIPRFVADLIEEYSKDFAPLGIVYQILNRSLEKDVQNHWQNNEVNQKLLLNAIANGYEVENEIEKYVRLKGFAGTTGYLNYDVNLKEFFVDTTGLDSCTKTKFTKSWLKDNFPEYEAYNDAGLLEFVEVEDD